MQRRSVAAIVVVCAVMDGGCTSPSTPSEQTSQSSSSRPATKTAPASTSGPSDQSPTPTGTDGAKTVTVVMNGDLLWHENYPTFAAPPQVAKAIKSTGYDLCTTASNHSLDQGFAGLKRTLKDLDDAGIVHADTARTRRESLEPTVYTTAEGVKIAVVSATYGLNGIPRPEGKAWSVKPLEAKSMLADAKRAKKAGADIVIAAMHAGDEYSSQENAQQRSMAKALTASPDVDLVYGHHAHVAQPWTTINGKWVAYGLGNTVAQHRTPVKRGSEGVTARFTFSPSPKGGYRVSRAEYIPTYVSTYRPGKPARLYRVSEELKTANGDFRARLIDAQKRTDRVVLSKKPAGLIRS